MRRLVILLALSLNAFAASEIADAAMRGDIATVRALIAKKADVNSTQADGATALHWAVYKDDAAMSDALLAAGANAKTANRDGATPMSLAAINGSASMMDRLLKAGVDINERQPNGETALMFASRTGSLEAMKLLLDHGAQINAVEKLRGTSALMWAAQQKHPAAVKLLIDRGANVNLASSVVVQRGARPNVAPTAAQRAIQVVQQSQGRAQAAVAVAATAQTAPVAEENFGSTRPVVPKAGEMTALAFATREGDMESVKILVEAKADVNKVSVDGWSPLLIAAQNRHYKIGQYLLEHGANPNQANEKGWTSLYLATDNRNIEGGEYPVPPPDMDHLDFIKLLLSAGANPNLRAKDYTETRNNFTMQWLNENGATPFLRAAQSGDVALMKLLLEKGADPRIATANGTTALMTAAGIGWVDGITYEWSPKDSLEAVRMCLDLGLEINARDADGRTALHGAAHKGRNEVVQLLVDRGAKLDIKDNGSRDTLSGELSGQTWMAVHYADGLVRVGVQSAIPHPETAALLRKLMKDAGLPVPDPSGQTVCVTPEVCK